MKITKTHFFLFLIVALGLILRIITAMHVDIGSDEMIYDVIPLNIISAGRLSTVEQAPVYFYLVDIGYKLTGGLTLLSGRLPSIVFGAFASLVVFLLAWELFQDRRAALFSAFLFALSGYALRYSQEMDMAAFFFGLLSMYFFIRAMKHSPKNLYGTALFLALATLVKPIVLVLAPAYVISFLYYGHTQKKWLFVDEQKKIRLEKSVGKIILLSLLLCILVVMPVLVYNYLLYKEKGMTDYYFTVLAGIGENAIYQGQEANAWSIGMLWNVLLGRLRNLLQFDLLILLFGVAGLVWFYKKDKVSNTLFLLSFFFLVGYLGGKMGGVTHFLWLPLVLSIFAGYGIMVVMEKYAVSLKYAGVLIIFLLIANAGYALYDTVDRQETSIAAALRNYADENIQKEAIVVLDPRIYRGVYAWSFNDLHYLEGTYFPKLMEAVKDSPEAKREMPLYYLECGPGTYCGWKPEDFERISPFAQELSASFGKSLNRVAELNAIDTVNVYAGSIELPVSVYEAVDRTHSLWYTPVGWKYPENAPDNYTPRTLLDKFLNKLGFFILYLDVAAALGSLALVVYLLGKKRD